MAGQRRRQQKQVNVGHQVALVIAFFLFLILLGKAFPTGMPTPRTETTHPRTYVLPARQR